jgi:hypothetical protein
VSTGSTSSGVGASLLLDPLGVDVGDAVLLSFAAGLDVASDDPPLHAAREALARTPASRQATRRWRVMVLIRPRLRSRDSNDLAAVRCRQLCAMSTKRE